MEIVEFDLGSQIEIVDEELIRLYLTVQQAKDLTRKLINKNYHASFQYTGKDSDGEKSAILECFGDELARVCTCEIKYEV